MFDGIAMTINYKVVDLLLPVLSLKKLIDYTKCLKILGLMKIEDQIDPDIFDEFVKNQVYQDSAREILDAEQIDEIDEVRIPGYAN